MVDAEERFTPRPLALERTSTQVFASGVISKLNMVARQIQAFLLKEVKPNKFLIAFLLPISCSQTFITSVIFLTVHSSETGRKYFCESILF